MPHRANRSYVSNADALTAWTPIARDALLETARRYGAVITYEELADTVQARSGITGDRPVTPWVSKLLERVTAEQHHRNEPALAALCVKQDGSIGEGYTGAPRSTMHPGHSPSLSPIDRERLAAGHRLLCYRHYADDLPADGGELVVHRPPPRTVNRARSAPAPRQGITTAPTRTEVTCHQCFLIVAARPTCSSCGAPLPAS